MLNGLSYRLRAPLNVTLVVLLTGLAISASLLWYGHQRLEEDARDNLAYLAGVLSQALPGPLRKEDIWQAYRTLTALYHSQGTSWLLPEAVLVLDTRGRVLVSSDPRRYRLARLAVLDLPLGELLRAGERTLKTDHGFYRVTTLPDVSGGAATLVLAYDEAVLWPRFRQLGMRILFTTLGVMLALLPLGWWLGRRIAEPLARVTKCLDHLHEDPAAVAACELPPGRDEIGRLGMRLEEVAQALEEKRRLERRMLEAERQAALGRLAAGVAHEINNPLGGMLNALQTYRRHPGDPRLLDETFSLLERGLEQIRQVVSALLGEVRAANRPLIPRDVDDLRELLAAEVERLGVDLELENHLADELPLPAGPVRQILLNLALNAVRASSGQVRVQVIREGSELHLEVTNSGVPLEAPCREHLFEPFAASAWDGSGLGLWVTYRLVERLQGRIEVHSDASGTRFLVILPLEDPQ